MCKDGRTVYLAGIGMGQDPSQIDSVMKNVQGCDCIIGAQRMADAFGAYPVPKYIAYEAGEIHKLIETHPNYKKILIALSGDVGFYSGAKKLEERLKGCRIERIPGISSVAYLAAKLHTSWDDAALLSAHGRSQNYIQAIACNEKTFLLLGGTGCGETLCRKLQEYRLEHVDCWIGRRLSYEDESLLHKKGGELEPKDCSELDVALILNPTPDKRVCRHIEDEEFIRGEVPMTKSEIRSASIAKLALTEDAVLYDIGAGTGSVAIEAALQSKSIRVYAVEKNPKGIQVIRQNKQKFRCDWLEIIEGEAPSVLESLDAPTHVFIGGSSGNLKEILKAVKKKNPDVRIVLNAISLETVKETMEAVEEGILREPDIVQIAASKSRKLGAYHMMCAMNPVYIITEGKG